MITPGSANAMLLANAGDPLDELGKIDRSVRFRAAATAVFSRVISVSGDRLKWKIVFWVKSTGLGTPFCLFDAYSDSINFTRCYLLSDGKIQFDHSVANTVVGQAITAGQRRDPAAHFEIAISYDSANATAADRMIIEIDGDRQPLGVYAAPAQNAASYMNTAGTTLFVGRTGSTALALDGYISYFRLFDGDTPSANAYGVRHPRTNQWRPKSKVAIRAAVAAGGGPRNGWGVNGAFLPFDDATSATTLGYDRSQSDTDTTGNNWAANNFSLTPGPTYDSMLDTPTNNFPTMNPLVNTAGHLVLAQGNLYASVGAADKFAHGTVALPTSGKWYFEYFASVAGVLTSVGVSDNTMAQYSGIGFSGGNFRLYKADGNKHSQSGVSAYGASYTTNDVIGVAVDMDAGTLTFYKNNVSQGIAFNDLVGGNWFSAIYLNSANGSINFGQRPFAYAPPAGLKPLCTKSLPVNPGGPMKPSNAFVAVTDTGANIASKLAAARAGWSGYIDIIKRRDANEGWRWIFSDDASYYMDSSSTAAKAAVPAFGGTSYVGYSLKVSAANGVATGRLTHTNGVADTVVDGLANSRKAIILRNEAGGDWFFYHPDLAAGKLLYLNLTNAETTDAAINNVTATGFSVSATLGTGTWRWIALAEVDGFLKLFKRSGNSSADGPFDSGGMLPGFALSKASSLVTNWVAIDVARSLVNVSDEWLLTNGANAEQSQVVADINSNGIKIRSSLTDFNGGGTYVGLMIAAFPLRYANAR